VRQAVEHAYASSLTVVFIAAIPALALGLLLALLLKDVPLRSGIPTTPDENQVDQSSSSPNEA